MVLTAFNPLGLTAQGIADIATRMRDLPCYSGRTTLSVSLPQTDTDVVYTIGMSSTATPADSLSPASYLIDWSLPTPSGTAEGFNAYFDGNLYRFRDSRLKEYHMEWDAMPFSSTTPGGGVQRTAQFASQLPQFLGSELLDMLGNHNFTLRLTHNVRYDGRSTDEIMAVMTIDGNVVQERRYLIDPASGLPLRIVTENSPGSIAEQTIIVDYNSDPSPVCQTLSEEWLRERYPDIFEKYRESNYHIENLRDTPLPTFALPTAGGDRITHHRGERLRQPTVIAIIDPETGSFNDLLLADIRSALDNATIGADAIFALTTTNPELAAQTTGSLRTGETVALNARSLARECGATALPVVIIADKGGVVRNVMLGYNKDIAESVLQTLELLR